MRKKPLNIATDPSEQRRLPRKDVLLDGVLADLDGEAALECTIRDIHSRGAAISLGKKLRVGAQIYLLDISNQAAHLARVAWSSDDRSGLLFVQSFSMSLGLPPRLTFLWRHLLEAKLRKAERALAAGASADVAFDPIGLNYEYLHKMARHAGTDARFQQLLQSAKRLLDG